MYKLCLNYIELKPWQTIMYIFENQYKREAPTSAAGAPINPNILNNILYLLKKTKINQN